MVLIDRVNIKATLYPAKIHDFHGICKNSKFTLVELRATEVFILVLFFVFVGIYNTFLSENKYCKIIKTTVEMVLIHVGRKGFLLKALQNVPKCNFFMTPQRAFLIC